MSAHRGTPLKQLSTNATPIKSPVHGQQCIPQQCDAQHFAASPEAAQAIIAECPCLTCQYYRAAMLYHHDCSSPMVDQYNMYSPHGMSPNAGMYGGMSPNGGMYGGMSPNAAAGMYGNMPHPPHGMPPMPAMNAMPPMPPHMMYPPAPQDSNPSSPQQQPPFDNVNPMANNTIAQFKACVGQIAATACTPNGRGLLQSVIRLQHVDKIQLIFDEIMQSCETVLLDQHGCHVVRSLIEVLDATQIASLVAALNETLILNMSTVSQYTRRVLQTLFEKHRDRADLEGVVQVVAKNARYLAATQQGCISMMRVFEKCSPEQQQCLIDNVLPMFSELACDKFGNYVVQCVLENIDVTKASQIVVDCFKDKLLKLSCNKFASNVVEKIVHFAPPALRRIILDELIFNPAALQQLVHDGFGNFVVQGIIESSATPNEHKKIHDRLKPIVGNSPYGHKIESKLRARRQFFSQQRNQTQLAAGSAPRPMVPVQA